MTLSRDALADYVARQISTFFPDRDVRATDFASHHKHTLERVEHCFKHIRYKYFFEAGEARFDHCNTDQYAMYLYYLSNSIHRFEGDPALSSKIFALNKALHGLDVYYEVALPDIFAWQHPVGTVLGRAQYADYFYVFQRCTVGGNVELQYPTFEPNVVMYGDAAVIGKAHVGTNTWMSIGTKVLNQEVGGDKVVFGHSPHITQKPARRSVYREFFDPEAVTSEPSRHG